MEENSTINSQPINNGSMKKYAIPAAVITIIVIAAIAFYTTQSNKQASPVADQMAIPTQATDSQMQAQKYKNGTYTVTGNYVSPGGPRDIGVTVTLADGVVVDAVFEGRAVDPTSRRFQGEFGNNFKPMVVGKNIEDLELSKISGSSLTPKGFNDALVKVKTQAQQL